MAPSTEIQGFVVVVTYGRSGSTLVQNLLNAIDGYCIRGENNNILGPLVRAFLFSENSTNLRNIRRAKIETSAENPWFGAENILPDRFGRKLAKLFLNEIVSPPAGTRVAGFKEIRWGHDPAQFNQTLNFIARFFPNARIIFNTRDHDAVARSGWWADMDPAKVKKSLVETERLFTAYAEQFPDRSIRIHYDDYTADPNALKPLFDFLGEPWNNSLVQDVMDTKLTHLK